MPALIGDNHSLAYIHTRVIISHCKHCIMKKQEKYDKFYITLKNVLALI